MILQSYTVVLVPSNYYYLGLFSKSCHAIIKYCKIGEENEYFLHILSKFQLPVDVKLDHFNLEGSKNFVSRMSARGLAHGASLIFPLK